MRKIFLAFVFAEMIPVISFAQDDDVYFVPKKEKEVIVSHDYVMMCGSSVSRIFWIIRMCWMRST